MRNKSIFFILFISILLMVASAVVFAYPFDVSNDIRSGLEQDSRVVCYNEKAYIIERAGSWAAGDGTIMVLPLDNMTGVPEASYSVGNGSNPYDIEFYDTTKAYVSRYATADVVVINPDNGTIRSTIKPSDYGCSSSAVPSYMYMLQKWGSFSLEESRLFIAVQDGWGSPGKVIVFDAETDIHLATISLTLQNPNADIDYVNGLLYVSCTGDWSDNTTSGVQVIDPWAEDGGGDYTYPVSVLFTTGQLDTAAETIHDIEIVNKETAFAVVGKTWGSSFNIIRFNPDTAVADDALYLSYTSEFIGDIKAYMPGYLFVSQTDKDSSTGTDFPVYDFMKDEFATAVNAGSEVVYSLASHSNMVIATSSNYNYQTPDGYISTIMLDNPNYTDAAASVIVLNRGPLDIADPEGGNASWGSESDSLGAADGSVVSLGDGGSITLKFADGKVLDNVEGPDFGIFENGSFSNWPAGHSGYYFELGFVEVSSDGVHFVRFPTKTLNDSMVGGFSNLSPMDYTGFAGNSLSAVSTNYDLDDLTGNPAVDNGTVNIDFIEYVRVVDAVGNGSTYDSEGNPVYDPYPTGFSSCGFDFDAVGGFTKQDTRCHANLDSDVVVGLSDLVIMKIEYGNSTCDPEDSELCCKADIDSDGVVGFSDLVIMKLEYGRSDCPVVNPPCSF